MNARPLTLTDLQALLAALGALRHGRALALLFGTLSLAGLMLASIEPALAADSLPRALLWLVAGLVCLFYGVNAAGWMLMQTAQGRDARLDAFDAVRTALRQGHRVLGVVLLCLLPVALIGLLLLVGVAASRLPWVGAPLLAVLAPLAVLVFGWLGLSLAALVVPLAAPAVWAGLTVVEAARWLRQQARHRLLEASLLQLALTALVGLVGAGLSLVLLIGVRSLTLLLWLVEVPVPPQQVMAHLFGHTLRTLGSAGAPVVANPSALALSVGGGLLVALVLVLPMAVYLRGCCANFLSLRRRD